MDIGLAYLAAISLANINSEAARHNSEGRGRRCRWRGLPEDYCFRTTGENRARDRQPRDRPRQTLNPCSRSAAFASIAVSAMSRSISQA